MHTSESEKPMSNEKVDRPTSQVERVHVPGSAPFAATITDGKEVVHSFDAAGWRYVNKRVTVLAVMPDGGIVEQHYAVDMNVAFVATNESFECRLGRGMHRYEGMMLIVHRNA